MAASLLYRRHLFDRGAFDVGSVALFIGLVQEAVDDDGPLLLLDLSFALFPVQQLVVNFPAHFHLRKPN
jgi:hypothetical protein